MNRETGYESSITLRAARGDVFAAVTTLEGLRGWWTTLVKGSPASGGELRFDFEGVDEHIAHPGLTCRAWPRLGEGTGVLASERAYRVRRLIEVLSNAR